MTLKKSLWTVSEYLQRMIVPGLKYSQTAFEETLRRFVGPGSSWLDLGCGHQVLPPWRADAERALVGSASLTVGIDYDLPSLQKHRTIRDLCRGEISSLPFARGSFSLVTANMVVEHLDDPERQFREIARVLRPGGVFLFHTPNAISYLTLGARVLPDATKRHLARVLEGRDESDVFPTFYRANRVGAIHELAQRTGFEVPEVQRIVTTPVFNAIPPLALAELLWIRALTHPMLAGLRTNLICALVRRDD